MTIISGDKLRTQLGEADYIQALFSRTFTYLNNKYGKLALSAASIIGFLSFIGVHYAGFILSIPPGLRPLVDAVSIANLAAHFSFFLALSALISRFATPFISAAVSPFLIVPKLIKLFLSKKGRRYLQMKGRISVNEFSNQNEAKVDRKVLQDSISDLLSMSLMKQILGASYLSGSVEGWLVSKIDRYSFAIQSFLIVGVLSYYYVSLDSIIVLFAIIFFLVIFFPPSVPTGAVGAMLIVLRVFFRTDLNIPGEPFFSVSKITVILLSVSFYLGFSHGKHLASENFRVQIEVGEGIHASVVASTASGFIVSATDNEYYFVPSNALMLANGN